VRCQHGEACEEARIAISNFPGARLLITGVSGFVGSALLRVLECAARTGERWEVFGISRTNPHGHSRKLSLTALDPTWLKHDIRSLIPDIGDVDFVVHAATPTARLASNPDSLQIINTAVLGMQNVMAWAASMKKPPLVLHTSSGAVYGEQPKSLLAFPEEYIGSIDSFNSQNLYAESKRAAEMVLASGSEIWGIPVVNTRLFAFSGQDIPLRRSFAIGNFVADGVASRPVRVAGTGRPIRSYLDQTDMAAWILGALIQGPSNQTLHIGSQKSYHLADVAKIVAEICHVELNIEFNEKADGQRMKYVPSTEVTRSHLKMKEWTTLESSIASWVSALTMGGRDFEYLPTH